MSDEPFYAPFRKPPPPRQPRPPGELLWEFRREHITWSAELHNDAPHGWEVHLLRGGDFFASRRFDLRDAAIGWSNAQRADIEKGWTK
jgi:hypothetical protein